MWSVKFYGVDYGRDYVPMLNKYESDVSWNLNTALRHHAGKVGRNTGFGLRCDDAGWELLESILDYNYTPGIIKDTERSSDCIATNRPRGMI